MWYSIVFNENGHEIFRSPTFDNSFQATQWGKSKCTSQNGNTYQLFQE